MLLCTMPTHVLTADAQRHARALELARSDGAVAVKVPRAEELQQPRHVRGERRQQLRYVLSGSMESVGGSVRT